MSVSHVVAMAENRVIGRAGGLPWHIPEDLKRFRRLTMGHALLMGRKTYQSIGRPLPGRLSVVVTRDAAFAAPPGVVVVADVEAGLAACAGAAPAWGDEVFVIGGGEIYAATLAAADRLYITAVHAAAAGDTFYPALPEGAFRRTRAEPGAGDVPFTWGVWERAAPGSASAC